MKNTFNICSSTFYLLHVHVHDVHTNNNTLNINNISQTFFWLCEKKSHTIPSGTTHTNEISRSTHKKLFSRTQFFYLTPTCCTKNKSFWHPLETFDKKSDVLLHPVLERSHQEKILAYFERYYISFWPKFDTHFCFQYRLLYVKYFRWGNLSNWMEKNFLTVNENKCSLTLIGLCNITQPMLERGHVHVGLLGRRRVIERVLQTTHYFGHLLVFFILPTDAFIITREKKWKKSSQYVVSVCLWKDRRK